MAREPSPPRLPTFLGRSVANDLDLSGGVRLNAELDASRDSIEADMREAMAQHLTIDPYAPKRNGTTPPEVVSLVELERLTAAPLYSVAVAVSELRFHDAIEFAQGVITKSDALKSIPPHELAAALNGWSLQARTNEGA